MKKLFHFATFSTVALPLFFCVCIMAACGKGASSSKEQVAATESGTETASAEVGEEGESMKAPKIEADASGLIRLSQCPTTYEKLEVAVSEDNTTVTISYDGREIQTISDPDEGLMATGENEGVHFMDANFDGYVDIFLGPGESRTYSTLLIWDKAAQQFKRVGTLGDPSFQNIMLYPSKKQVFEGGSGSWCSDFFSRRIWDGDNLKTEEELVVVSQADQYGEYEVENKYTLKDDQQNAILSTDDDSSLPAPWKSVLDHYLGNDMP